MSAFLSPVFGAGAQLFTNAGLVLAGGLIQTYIAGSTTPMATWTDSTQATQNANPVVLNSAGRATTEIWLANGVAYKFVVMDSNSNVLGTYDNIVGVNVTSFTQSQWMTSGLTVTYASGTTFTVPGNQTSLFPANTRVQYILNGGTYYGYVSGSVYDGSTKTTVTVVPDVTNLDNTLSAVNYGLITATNTSIPQQYIISAADKVPSRTGNAGKFLTTTDGVNSSWGYAGISTINATVTASATVTGSYKYIPVAMTALGQSLTLPDATTLSAGGPQYIIDNRGGYSFGIRDSAGGLIMAIAPGGEALVSLKDASTAAGVWSLVGTQLEPGLITIDNTFSSTYSATILSQYVALDNNTSIHFAPIASGFAAFIVDNLGKVLTTPVTVSSTSGHTPYTAFKISSTQAVVFYGASSGTSTFGVVLTISGSSPSLALAVGTGVSVATTWQQVENFIAAPTIAQLSTTSYLLSGCAAAAAPSVVACSISGTTVSFGTMTAIGATAGPANSTIAYTLTSTTGLVLYKTGASAPYTIAAVVISVSGTTCTVNTPATSLTSSASTPCAATLVSATKCLIADDRNTTKVSAAAITVSAGTTVAAGTALDVETGLSSGLIQYTTNSATRYNPHLWTLTTGGTNTVGLWYFDSSNVSRAVILSETSGTVTSGTAMYNSICTAATATNLAGAVKAQGTGEFISIQQEGSTVLYKKKIIPHKTSGSTVTVGNMAYLGDMIAPQNSATDAGTKLSGGDYLLMQANYCPGIYVVRTNGDAINFRGLIKTPFMYSVALYCISGVSSNRVVVPFTAWESTLGTATNPLRLINVEIAQ